MTSVTNLNLLNVLTIVFTAAKVLGYFQYSWWLVFLPSLVGAGLAVALVMLIGLITIADEVSL